MMRVMKKFLAGIVVVSPVVAASSAFAGQPTPWQLSFQEPATQMMEQIIWFERYTLAFIVPITILVLLLWDAPVARLSAATLALIGVFFSAYLVVVQLFVIDAVCIWCMANDLVVAPALAVLTVLRLRS